MKKINLFIGLFLSFSTLIAQEITEPTFIAKYGDNKLDIPYEKWELPNGLTILVHEDHSDPIVYLGVTYHVGSAREKHGKTGYAHFFEHILCMGSEHAPDKGQWNLIEKSGGINNASTWYDETKYFQVFPSNYLERIMFLESDRMGFAYNEFNMEAFEAQRGAVKNEKIERCHTPLSPYMMLEKLFVDFFPPSHPYNWPVIGYVEDLDRATLDDMRDWLKRWYGPNNATLVISGDVNTKDVIEMANKYFGGIPRGEIVRKMKKQPVRLSSDKYVSYVDPYTGVPMTVMAFPTVPKYHKDAASLEILSQLLANGKSSPFYQKFVKSDKAISVDAGVFTEELAGLLLIQYMPRPEMEMYSDEAKFYSNINDDIRKALLDFEGEGFSSEDIERIQNQYEASFIEQYETVSAKANAISAYSIYTSDRINLTDELNSYLSVTSDDVMRVYNKYIKNRKAVILDIKTSNPFRDKKDTLISFNPYSPSKIKPDPQYEGLEYNRPIEENIDRNNPPSIMDAASVKAPDYYTRELSNGMKVIGMKTESPVIKLLLQIEGGSLVENKIGVANMTASLMNEGTKNSSAESISNELDRLGSSINFTSSRNSTNIIVSSLEANIVKTLKILEEKLYNPGFIEEDFERLKKNKIQSEENIEKNREVVAQRVFREKIFGDNLYGDYPKKKDIKKIKLKDLRKYYNDNYSPKVSKLIIVADLDESEIMDKINFLGEWSSKEVNIPNSFNFPTPSVKPQIYICDFPGSTQSSVLFGHRSLKYDYKGESFKNEIVNYPLGGNGLTSRISKIREEGGETYGVRSYFSNDNFGGYFAVSSNISTKGTVKSLKELISIIQDYINTGVKEEELNITKQNMINSELMGYESNYQKLFLLAEIISFDLPKDYTTQQKDIVNNISKDDINDLAKKSINPNEFVIVIAGNQYVIQKELKELGYKITEIKY